MAFGGAPCKLWRTGRGYGMAIIRGIADRHRANLEVDSELGAGTTITLIFNNKRGEYR